MSTNKVSAKLKVLLTFNYFLLISETYQQLSKEKIYLQFQMEIDS